MSTNTYEVAFKGEIADGASPEKVKSNIAQMFKADAAKLAQLFSGNRVVIKKGIDEQTAMKYKAAFTKAGAVCEVVSLEAEQSADSGKQQTAVSAADAKNEVSGSTTNTSAPPVVKKAMSGTASNVPGVPQTVPLDISGDQIQELAASVAPVGSDMQDSKQEVPDLVVDLTGMEMAPAGSDLVEHKEKPVPPPPDTSGLSIKE